MVLNPGISFGILPGFPLWVQVTLILVLTLYAVKMRELRGRVGVFLIIIGGLGNIYLRILYGAVLDDLSFFGIIYNNIWDYLIVGGVVVWLWSEFRTYRSKLRG